MHNDVTQYIICHAGQQWGPLCNRFIFFSFPITDTSCAPWQTSSTVHAEQIEICHAVTLAQLFSWIVLLRRAAVGGGHGRKRLPGTAPIGHAGIKTPTRGRRKAEAEGGVVRSQPRFQWGSACEEEEPQKLNGWGRYYNFILYIFEGKSHYIKTWIIGL